MKIWKNFIFQLNLLDSNSWSDLIEERYILNLCGYPTCSNFVETQQRQLYHIDRVHRKVLLLKAPHHLTLYWADTFPSFFVCRWNWLSFLSNHCLNLLYFQIFSHISRFWACSILIPLIWDLLHHWLSDKTIAIPRLRILSMNYASLGSRPTIPSNGENKGENGSLGYF